MEFHDTRVDTSAPLPPGILRLLGAVVAGAAAMESSKPQINHCHITVADYDPKTGLSVPHLQLNFEPQFLDDRVKFWWSNAFRAVLRSELLENQEWKRYAWGVWEVADPY